MKGEIVEPKSKAAEIEAVLAERPRLTEKQAKKLTDRIRETASWLERELVDAYEGCAHEAMGYTSWGAYCADLHDSGLDDRDGLHGCPRSGGRPDQLAQLNTSHAQSRAHNRTHKDR